MIINMRFTPWQPLKDAKYEKHCIFDLCNSMINSRMLCPIVKNIEQFYLI